MYADQKSRLRGVFTTSGFVSCLLVLNMQRCRGRGGGGQAIRCFDTGRCSDCVSRWWFSLAERACVGRVRYHFSIACIARNPYIPLVSRDRQWEIYEL